MGPKQELTLFQLEESFPQLRLRLGALAASEVQLSPPQRKLLEAYNRAGQRAADKIASWITGGSKVASGGGAHPAALLIKPVGDRCNLACQYCYESLRQSSLSNTRIMTLREMRSQVSKALSPPSTISEIYLHGGEPLLAGKPFFREFVAAVRASAAGTEVRLGVQTNGVLLDDEWAQIFLDGSIQVGLSLDGDQAINDLHRLGLDGRSTYRQVKRGIEVLRRNGIAFGVISVFSNTVAKMPGSARRILRNMADLGIREFDLHPAFTPFETSGGASSHNVEPENYALFMASAFDEWITMAGDFPTIRTFEDFLLTAVGVSSDVCHRSGQCMTIAGVNEGGEMQPCTRPFDAKYAFGNLNSNASFANIFDAAGYHLFKQAEHAGQELTAKCKWRNFCGNGGCPHERFTGGVQDPGGKHTFCTCHSSEEGGYPGLFNHIAKRIFSHTESLATGTLLQRNDFIRSPAD